MMEISLQFMAWLCVLFIQAIVHVKVVYLKKGRDDDEPRLMVSESSEHSWTATASESMVDSVQKEVIVVAKNANRPRSFSDDPALDDTSTSIEFADEYDEDEDDDDDPPNLKQRLSQTGSEFFSVSFGVFLSTNNCGVVCCLSSLTCFFSIHFDLSRAANPWSRSFMNRFQF